MVDINSTFLLNPDLLCGVHAEKQGFCDIL